MPFNPPLLLSYDSFNRNLSLKICFHINLSRTFIQLVITIDRNWDIETNNVWNSRWLGWTLNTEYWTSNIEHWTRTFIGKCTHDHFINQLKWRKMCVQWKLLWSAVILILTTSQAHTTVYKTHSKHPKSINRSKYVDYYVFMAESVKFIICCVYIIIVWQ